MKEPLGVGEGREPRQCGWHSLTEGRLEAGLGRPSRADLLKQTTPRGKRISHSAAWGPAIFPCRHVCIWKCWEHSGSCGLHSVTSLSPSKHWKGWEEHCAHGATASGALGLYSCLVFLLSFSVPVAAMPHPF